MASDPWIVLLIGAPAAGKTSVAHALLSRLAPQVVPHLRTDAIRQSMVGNTWSPHLRLAAYEGVLAMAASLTAHGLPVLIDGNYLDAAERARIQALPGRLLRVLVHCSLPSRLARNRLRQPSERVPEERIAQAHTAAEALKVSVDLVVDTDVEPPEDAALHILNALHL
ncbi:MAG: ATP-binding protein [Candidatus Xenobia bacterium]